MKNERKKKGAVLLTAATMLATSTPVEGAVAFEDVAPPYDEAIHHLVERGVAEGIQGGTFGTYEPVKRVDAAILLARVLELPEASQSTTLFADVPKRATSAIYALEAQGIVIGRTDGRFDSETTITRGEVALLLSRAFDLTEGEAHSFTDVPARYDEAVRSLVHYGMTKGVKLDRFEPERPVTRGEYALFLYRALHFDSSLYKQQVKDRVEEGRALDETAYTTDSWKRFLQVLDQLERESEVRDVWTAADATDVLARIDAARDQLDRRSTGGGGGSGTVRTPILQHPLHHLQLEEPARLGDQPLEGVWVDPRTSRVVQGTFRWVKPDEQVIQSGAYEWVFEPEKKRYRTVKGTLMIYVARSVPPEPEPDPTPSADREPLERLLQSVQSLQADDYTTESWERVQRACEAGRQVLQHASEQDAFDEAMKQLQSALDGLAKRPIERPEPEPDPTIPSSPEIPVVLTPAMNGVQVDGTLRSGEQLQVLSLQANATDPKTGKRVEGDIRWLAPHTIVKQSGAYEWVFEPVDTEAYRSVKGTIDVRVVTLDRTVLEHALQKAESFDAKEYTVASYRVLEARIAKAYTVLRTEEVDQRTIDAEVSELQTAIEQLVLYTVDSRPLDRLVKEATALRLDDYTPATARALERAIADAKETLRMIDVDQQRVDASYAMLTNALGQLIFSNEPLLRAMLATATTTLSTVKDKAKRGALQTAIDQGTLILRDVDRTKASIDERIRAIEYALKEAEEREALRWTGLIEQMERAAAYEQHVYPDALDAPFRQAILQAKRALAATEQSVIGEAERVLREATDGLERYRKEKEDEEKRERQIRDVERALERFHSFETDEKPMEDVVRDYAVLATSDLGVDISIQSNGYATFTIVVTKGEARGEKTITVRQRVAEQSSREVASDADTGSLQLSFEHDAHPSVVTFSERTGESYRIYSRVAPRQATSTIPLKS